MDYITEFQATIWHSFYLTTFEEAAKIAMWIVTNFLCSANCFASEQIFLLLQPTEGMDEEFNPSS